MLYSAGSLTPGSIMPAVNINPPIAKEIKAYLGIKDEKSFSLTQVQAKLMVIELFEVYCPICQTNAPLLNELFKLIQEDKNLNKEVKMIGLAIGTQPEDLSVYRGSFKIEFPLFPDPMKEIQNKLNIKYVPEVLIINKQGKILMSHPGKIESLDPFLVEIRKNILLK
jgi:hypothetical protein